MKNLDVLDQGYRQLAGAMVEAAKGEDAAAFENACVAFAAGVEEEILRQAKEMANTADVGVLAARGVRQLTGQETKYYQALAEAMRAPDPKMALTQLEPVLPETVIDQVFEDLTEQHPLLAKIRFTNTSVITKWILSTSGGAALWDKLNTKIKAELEGAFDKVDLTLAKLTAFFPVHKDMLNLGPAWLDRFVRTVLAESIAVALEAAIVDGDGKDKPIGMTRKLSGATDSVYPRKTPVKVTSLTPVTLGGILDTLSKGPKDKRRAVPRLLMVVGPSDYYTKVFPATTVRTTDGGWNGNTLPYPADVVVSAAVPDGHAVFGIANKYFMGLGSSQGGKIEYSDEYRFLEDERVYAIRLYGNGRATDENAFVYADISELKPALLQVELAEPEV